MRAAAGPLERALEHLLGLERRRTLGRQARVAIPQRPRREVHQRVGEERRDVEIVGMRAIHGTHRLGVVGVPRDEVGRRVVDLVAAPERLDERPLDRRGAVRARARRRDLVARLLERRREVDRVERLPLLVVVRPDRVGDAPVRQREAGVVLDRALEAPDRLLVVERVGPHEPAVEPRLGARRGRRRPARVGAEIEVGLHRCRSRPGLSHVSATSSAEFQRHRRQRGAQIARPQAMVHPPRQAWAGKGSARPCRARSVGATATRNGRVPLRFVRAGCRADGTAPPAPLGIRGRLLTP